MRIRFITGIPLSVTGGSGAYVGIQTLATGLRVLGAKVDLVTPAVHLPIFTAERILFNESLRFRKNDGWDVSVGFDMDGYSVAGRTSTPHVACIKGVLADAAPFERGLTRASLSLQARLEALHVRRSNLVMTDSVYCAVRVEQLYKVPRPQSIVPEAIDLPAWRDLFRRNPAAVDPRKFTVLCVCRFYARKRVRLLLGAAALLKNKIPELQVRIVGGGQGVGELKKLWQQKHLEQAVHWMGDLSRPQLAAEYNRADVFCLPSVQEGFGIVFLEAMAAGKPIVAARSAAVPEVVRHGILVKPESEQALADGIEKLYREPKLRSSLGAEGSRFVEQFDSPRVARQFMSELQKLL